MSIEKEFRSPEEFEIAILQRLLSIEFPDVERLRAQLSDLMVRGLDEDYCLELKVLCNLPAPKAVGIPVEGSYVNSGEWDIFVPKMHVLLHVDSNGFMHELEFYTDDNKPITKPTPEMIHVEVNENC